MTALEIVFSRRASEHIRAIFRYLTQEASPIVAERYVSRLTDFCHSLAHFPHRGLAQHEIMPDLRILTYARSITVAYVVEPEAVIIVGVYTAGQDYLSALAEASATPPE